LKDVKIEIWKKNECNRKQGALKAQIHIAQGSALGNVTRPSNSAPCKGNCIKIEGCEYENMEGKTLRFHTAKTAKIVRISGILPKKIVRISDILPQKIVRKRFSSYLCGT
jgi:hypothetical protein